MAEVLRTARLRLRAFTLDDAPFVLSLVDEPSFRTSIGDRGVHDLASAEQYLRDGPLASYSQHGFGLWCLRRTADDAPIGMCGLLRRAGLEDPDLGFALVPDSRGVGFASEAAAATLDHGHGALGLARILAVTSPSNTASQRVLGRIGMQRVGTVELPGVTEPNVLFRSLSAQPD